MQQVRPLLLGPGSVTHGMIGLHYNKEKPAKRPVKTMARLYVRPISRAAAAPFLPLPPLEELPGSFV